MCIVHKSHRTIGFSFVFYASQSVSWESWHVRASEPASGLLLSGLQTSTVTSIIVDKWDLVGHNQTLPSWLVRVDDFNTLAKWRSLGGDFNVPGLWNKFHQFPKMQVSCEKNLGLWWDVGFRAPNLDPTQMVERGVSGLEFYVLWSSASIQSRWRFLVKAVIGANISLFNSYESSRLS